MSSKLFDLRDQLVTKLQGLPGFLTVGISKQRGMPVFVVSIDSTIFDGSAPEFFAGYRVLVRDLGHPVAQVCGA
jgi:hypothetical protein